MVPQQGYVTVSRRPPDIEDYIDILRRYRSWIVGPTFAGLVVAVVVAFLWPDTFVSTAVMRITPQQISERLVPSNISTQMAERLMAMQQQIESRTSLQELIQRPSLNLYPKERQRKPMEDVIEQMRKTITITLLDTGATQPQQRFASAFAISFKYADRYKAQAVVRELVSKFTEETNNQLRQQANTTTQFLNDQLKISKDNIDRLDADIDQVQAGERRPPARPVAGATCRRSTPWKCSCKASTKASAGTRQDKMMLETQIQNLQHQSTSSSSEPGADRQPGAGKESTVDPIERPHPASSRRSYRSLRQTYKEDHPDIRSAGSQAGRAQEGTRRSGEGGNQLPRPRRVRPRKSTNPQVAQSLENLKLQIANVQTQIQTRNMEMEERVKRQKELQC